MDELAKLQLVSKVCGRLDEELGVGDRTLAEFVIHLAETQGTPSAFGAALAENGADFPEPFVAALFALVDDARRAPAPPRPPRPPRTPRPTRPPRTSCL